MFLNSYAYCVLHTSICIFILLINIKFLFCIFPFMCYSKFFWEERDTNVNSVWYMYFNSQHCFVSQLPNHVIINVRFFIFAVSTSSNLGRLLKMCFSLYGAWLIITNCQSDLPLILRKDSTWDKLIYSTEINQFIFTLKCWQLWYFPIRLCNFFSL